MSIGKVKTILSFFKDQTQLSSLLHMSLCTVPKVFPITEVEPKTRSTMKLTKKKIRWIIRQKEKKESSGVIAKI
ncbi:MAG: hypothetical protein ACP5NN_08720, partial [Methanolinea sp.]